MPKKVSTNPRDTLKTLMTKTQADHKNWTYLEIRPLTPPATWRPGQHVTADCSKGVQYLCKWADAPDPMGNGFSNWGNSTTICVHLDHLDKPSQLAVGDIVTFGQDGDAHATMVYETGDDPMLWSFGYQGAPNFYKLSEDGRVAQYLRLPVPIPVPTPAEKLREMTGYWSWLKWRLGEGEWKNYGKTNKKVRPKVPKLIPISWWKRYIKFLLNRNKGNKPSQ